MSRDAWFWFGNALTFLFGSVGGFAIGDGGGWPAWLAFVALTFLAANIASDQRDMRRTREHRETGSEGT